MRNARLAFALVLLLLAVAPAAAHADPYTLGPDGETADVFSYSGAIRERVYIPQPGVDTDGNGVTDDVAIEIIRPATIDRVAAIVDPSPYYSTVCRGNESQCIGDTNSDGVNDKWPLFLDNYFVPRGYAVIYAEALGTANGTGCVMHGGPNDVNAMKSVIDWLNGRVAGYRGANSTGGAVTATWHNGSSAMIGKSYDGTLTNAVAATGVDGLKAIVPESAIDDWYAYSRMGGIRFNTHYPRTLSNAVTDSADRAACAGPWATLDADDGDATGDRNAFWDDRDYLPDVANVRAAVLATHGLQDDNVRMDHLATWWSGLADIGAPRKLWLMRAGHADPFDVRRDVWVDTLHKWFDHWLYGIANDVMTQPRVDIQNQDESWSTQSDWPAPDTASVGLYLRGGAAAGDAGSVALTSGGAQDTLAWTDSATQTESQAMATPGGAQTARRVFLSAPLRRPLRISGTPRVDLKASLSQTQTNLGAILVDYGAGREVTTNNEGLLNDAADPKDCVGDSSTAGGDYDACYYRVTQPFVTLADGAAWRVTKGILDSSNRTSLYTPALASVGVPTDFPISLIPDDYVFPAGHQIGVILVGDYRSFSSVAGTAGTVITMDAKATTISLPVVGGAAAAAASGGFDTVAPAFTVPDDQAVTAPAGAGGAAVTWTLPVATDDQDPHPSVACDPASGSTFPSGTTTVTCTATDASGNTASGTFHVTVNTTPAPPSDAGGTTVGGTTTPISAPAGTPPAIRPGARPSITVDVVPIRLTRLKLKGGRRRATVTCTLAGARTVVTVTVRRHGSRKTLKTIRKTVSPGRVALVLKGLRKGRYDVTVRAKGAASRALRATVRVA
jgi:X-Pro dipeptidyl-peptidase